MSNINDIIFLEEYRIKKELKKVQKAMNTARKLISEGVKVPNDVMGRLQYLIGHLEQKLENFVENTNTTAL